MKVLLVYCNAMLENALPISISQLSACLKQAGIIVDLFDTTFYRYGEKSDTEYRIEALQFRPCSLNYNERNMEEDFKSKLENFQPDLIGFSVVEPTFSLAVRLIESGKKIIRQNGIKVAIGGVHCILAPETIEKSDVIDFICISEGEKALVDLCLGLESGKKVSQYVGLWVKENGAWIKNPRAPLTDLNQLPIMDFTIFGDQYLNKPMMGTMYRTISIETSRGCPYHCSYCGDYALKTKFKDAGSWYRTKTMSKIEEDLTAFCRVYNPEFLYIISDSFLSGSTDKVKKFADMYKNFSIPYWFNTRPEDITEEKVSLIKDIGCRRISIGLESGNEKFRREYLHRNYSNDLFIRACNVLKKYDISFSVNIIIGFPFETRETIFDSINLLRDIKPDGISTHIFSPYHGTEMRNIAINGGMIDPDLICEDFFQPEYSMRNNTISKAEILGLFRTIPLYIEMDKSEYGRIKMAEGLDEQGNKYFNELRKEYYLLKGW